MYLVKPVNRAVRDEVEVLLARIASRQLVPGAAAKAQVQARIGSGLARGELATGADAAALTRFYWAVIDGLSLQALDGASREMMLAMIGAAMRAWPEQPQRQAA
ncbi:MAG TPA: hypothetical protein VFE23_04990 [Usitatibacter sp.]|jgi:hypothetical protein|nr:hypothetical protein [Usitatibacter sp.]